MSIPQIEVKLTPGRPPRVQIDGVPVPGVASLGITSGSIREFPQLLLRVSGEVNLEGEGIVQIDSSDDPVPSMLALLDAIDPDELDRLALEAGASLDGGDLDTPGKTFVAALRKLIDP